MWTRRPKIVRASALRSGLLPLLLCVPLLDGCVSKEKAREQARAAFVAGQQQAMAQMGQSQGPSVTFTGPVRNTFIPWTAELTLAKALVAADYFAPEDPSEIIVHRGKDDIHVNPKKLLDGADVPLQPRDIVELKP